MARPLRSRSCQTCNRQLRFRYPTSMAVTLRRALESRVMSLYSQLLMTRPASWWRPSRPHHRRLSIVGGQSRGRGDAQRASGRADPCPDFDAVLESRHQRAHSFLAGVESICAEPRPDGGFGWGEECTSLMVQDLRRAKRGRYDAALSQPAHWRLRPDPPPACASQARFAWLAAPSTGVADYVVQATRDEVAIELLFGGDASCRSR